MDDLLTRFLRAYWSAVHTIDTIRLRAWEDRGLTLPQLRVLFLLRETPGATTGAIAARLGLTAATVSGLVSKLVDGGLVERGSLQGDRRVIPLHLTDDGASVAGEIRAGSRLMLASIAERLGGDLEAVTVSLERLAAASAVPAQAETRGAASPR